MWGVYYYFWIYFLGVWFCLICWGYGVGWWGMSGVFNDWKWSRGFFMFVEGVEIGYGLFWVKY